MNKIHLLTIGTTTLFACTPKEKPADQPEKMNVLFISVDDLRPELGCYGNANVKSPHFDELAAESTVFNRAYCQSPICMPSRASLMSGIRPENFKEDGSLSAEPMDTLLPGVLTLSKHFKENGYQTVSVGKIYHWNTDDKEGWTKRYNTTFYEQERSHGYCSGYQNEINLQLLENYVKQIKGKEAEELPRPPAVEMANIPDSLHADGKITLVALDELEKFAKSKEPFFLAAGYYRPHLPFTPPKKYWDMYERDEIELADNPFMPEYGISFTNWGELRRYGDVPNKGPVSDEKAKELIHGYYASVSFIDAQIGMLTEALEKLGLAKNTAIVIWGDHGWNLGEHGMWCKHTNYEISTRTSMIIKWPGVSKGEKTDALAGLIDLYPTLCDMTGIRIPEHVEGISLVPVLKDSENTVQDVVFSQWFSSYSMRTDQYRFIKHREPRKIYNAESDTTGIYEIYDHKNDPDENVNIAYRAENAKLLKELENKMNAQKYLK